MVLLTTVAAPPAFALVPYRNADPRARRVRLGKPGKTGDPVFIDGKAVGETPEGSRVRFAPCAFPGGVAGTVVGAVDGAYLHTTNLGFAAWPGYRKTFDGERVAGTSRDGSVLLVREDDFMSEGHVGPGEAALVRKDRRTAIGAAERAWIASDGMVVGFAFAQKGGGYVGAGSDRDQFPATPEAFAWKDGLRRVLGTWVVFDVNRNGTILGGRDSATHTSSGATSDTSRLFLNRDGRETPLNRHDLPFLGTAVLRDDGSVVALFHGGGPNPYRELSLAILADDRVERIPTTIGGRKPDWPSFYIDPKGRIVVPEGRTKLWQVVRSPA